MGIDEKKTSVRLIGKICRHPRNAAKPGPEFQHRVKQNATRNRRSFPSQRRLLEIFGSLVSMECSTRGAAVKFTKKQTGVGMTHTEIPPHACLASAYAASRQSKSPEQIYHKKTKKSI